jgi:hypothetical protein
LDTDANKVVRGSAARAIRQFGSAFAIGGGLIILAMWVFAKNSSVGAKIAVSFAMIAIAGAITLFACISSTFTIAEVRNRRLNFYFCGWRTRSIPVDAPTIFELRGIGRLKVLSIQSGRLSYVPNGALDYREVAELLRANGVAERKAV